MKRLLLAVLMLVSLPLAAQPASPHFLADGAHLAQRFTAFALREDVAEADPRVARTRDWLARAAQATGEEEGAIAAACVRTAKFLQDGARVRASALEPLEALATAAKPGRTMSDGLMAYVEARKQAPDKSHAAAMAALRGAGN
jgi:hypothetical protein